ncbi:protein unc-13 [Tanacetum coccineum]
MAATQHVSEVSSYRLVFLDSNSVMYGSLYIGHVVNARISPVLRVLKQNLTLLSAIVTERAQPLAIKDVMKASFEAYLMVLIAGGSARCFTKADHEMIEDDLKHLKRVAIGGGLLEAMLLLVALLLLEEVEVISLVQVLKIHTDDNVADLLTKAFDVSRGFIAFRGSLRRVNDGTEALLILPLFILWLDKVSTASAKLVPLGKVCTAIETLKKNTARALISLFTTISLSSTMAVLDSCPKHNMVAYLEKTEGNAEFHEIIDFLKRSSIHHALTVSPVVSTTFVEQFWTSAKSKTINNVRHITAKVAGKFLRWVEDEMVSPEVESEKWRRPLLHWMCVAFDVSTDGREEDFFPRNGM